MVRPIFLVGMMGAGKTTSGQCLADLLDWPFRDSDQEITALLGQSIPTFFATQGEAAFRLLEKKWIGQISRSPAVVATGGGLPIFHNNLSKLLDLGHVVYLQVDAATAQTRLHPSDRPLWQGKEAWEHLLSEREAIYTKAHFQVDTPGKSPDEVAYAIRDWYQSR